SGLSVGQHSIMAAYAGDANNGASISTTVTQTVNVGITTTTLTSGTNPATLSSSFTFTATVSSKSPIMPTGAASFSDGSNLLGAATLNSSGISSFAVSGLSAGQHLITAAYGGDANNAASTSAMLTQIVNGDFALSSSPTSATVAAGSLASYKIS